MRAHHTIGRRLLALFCTLCLTASALASDRQSILVLGDSLSAAYGLDSRQGWVALLSRRLQQTHPGYAVINASVSGATTKDGLLRLTPALQTHKPHVVIIELGGNDGLRGYPVRSIHENLGSLVQQAQDADARVLLLGMMLPPNYGPRYTAAFHQVYLDVAQEKQITLLPFMLENIATRAQMMQADGIHPTAMAQPVILDNVWSLLQPLLD